MTIAAEREIGLKRLFLATVGFIFVLGCGSATTSPTPQPTTPLTNQEIFSRPVLSRAYEQNQWVLQQPSGGGQRETPTTVGTALAGLKPSYASGLIYLEDDTIVSAQMVADYNTIRNAVLAQKQNAHFDVEVSLNPNPPGNKVPFANATAVVTLMTTVDAQLHPNGWWFDIYDEAPSDWVAAAAACAHAHGETIGGNNFTSTIPPNSDAVAFVDDIVSGSQYGFDFNRTQVAKLRAAAGSTVIIGHLQSNAQNQTATTSTESCIYIQNWTEPQRAAYLNYFASQQSSVGFTFMYPVFYPLCLGAYAYDPVVDAAPGGGTLYNYLEELMSQYNP